MATVYLRSTDGDDADDGSTWALAKATWASALTVAGPGGLIYASQAHAELMGATVTLGSSVANRIIVLAVDDSAEPPTALAKADAASHPKLRFDGAYNLNGFGYIYGVEFHTDGAAANDRFNSAGAAESYIKMEECYINNSSTGGSAGITIGLSSNSNWQRVLELINTDITVKRANTVGGISVSAGASFISKGGALVGGLGGTGRSLFGTTQSADRSARIDVTAMDVSALASDEYLFTHTNKADVSAKFKRIKTPLAFNAVLTSDFQSSFDAPFALASYGNGDEYTSFREDRREGICDDNTAIYRDGSGEVFSVELNSNAEAKEFTDPLRFKLCELVLDLTSATTITVHTLQDAGIILQNDEMWTEIESVDSTDLALGLFSSTRLASFLDTPTNLTSTAEAWTGDGGSSDTRSIAHTLSAVTGASSVPVAVWVCLAKPSTEAFACPVVGVS